jgi:hypothetical protein
MSELKKIGWKYGLIKVSIDYEGTDHEEQINHLVELYPDENGKYTSFCNARLMSIEELEFSLSDIKESGICEYFYDTGKFTWDSCKSCHNSSLDWEQSNKSMATAAIKENDKGETYLELTADILSQMGWAGGDEIELDCNSGGAFTLTKIEQKTTVQQGSEDDNEDNKELYAVYGGD